MQKKLLLILLALCLLLTVAACKKKEPTPPTTDETPAGDTPAEDEGTLRYTYPLVGPEGNAITVEVHAGALLDVKGTGPMPDLAEADDQPWYEHGGVTGTSRSDAEGGTILVKQIIVEEGITEIGENAFREFEKLQTVSLPASLTVIGFQAFSTCRNLITVTGGTGVTTVEAGAFRYCTVLESVEFSDKLISVEDSAFDNILLPGEQRRLKVTFAGNETAWQALITDAGKVKSGNQAFLNATVTYP